MAHRHPEPEDPDGGQTPTQAGRDGENRPETAALERPPVHPIACMQRAFEESIMESMEDPDPQESGCQRELPDAKARRKRLLEQDDATDSNGSYTARWRERPGAKYHPLWKLIAQISFGVHLLHQQLAKSDEEVVKIMKTHVDELDGFLERASEDFDLALADIRERIDYLKLPLEHVNIFDIMLDDRQFRTSIIEGNEKIERIVTRTAQAMNDSLLDVSKGLEANEELKLYLDRTGREWTVENEDLLSIYTAMCGNAEGWERCFRGLQTKGNDLGVVLVQLGSILNEMSKRAGVASRRSILASRAVEADHRSTSSRISNSPPAARRSHSSLMDKPLPRDPDVANTMIQPPVVQRDAAPVDHRFENPRPQPKPPVRRSSSLDSTSSERSHPRRSETADLADFLRTTGPPRSNMSSKRVSPRASPIPRSSSKLGRSRSCEPARAMDQTDAERSRREQQVDHSSRLAAAEKTQPPSGTSRPGSTEPTKLERSGSKKRGQPAKPKQNGSIEILGRKLSLHRHAEQTSTAADSAYSSVSSGSSGSSGPEHRPNTSPPPPRPRPHFALFPRSPAKSPALSTKSSVLLKPPPTSYTGPPTPPRRSASIAGRLKRRPSLSIFRRLFNKKQPSKHATPSLASLDEVHESS